MVRTRVLLTLLLLTTPVLALGGNAESIDLAPTYIELKGVAPDWWTPEVRAAADRAALQGKLLNPLTGETYEPKEAAAVVDIPAGSPDYLFVRPGALALSHDDGALCTYNFIYSARTQIGLAGHCVARNNEPMYILASPGPTIPLITRLGTVASHSDGGVGNDWALVTIDAQWRQWVDPNMAYLGGPSCSAWTGQGGIIKHVGHGIQTGVVAAVPRVGLAGLSTINGGFTGQTEVSGGDSGSALILANGGPSCQMGIAAGVLTHCASIGGLVCLPIFWATDIRKVPATVTIGFDPR